MSKTPAPTPALKDPKVVVYKARGGQEVQLTIDLVRNFLVTGKKELVTTQEFMYFMGICRARGLNPFAKDCYLIKYSNDPAAIVTAIDFYRSRARAQPDCTGWEKGVICLHKETGVLRYSKGLVLASEEIVGGWFRATPVGWTVPFELEVNLGGYIKKTADGAITKFWRPENQPTMIAKVAESQGLRTLWPDEFQGTITAEEAGLQLDSFETVDITDIQPGEQSEPEPEVDLSEYNKLVKGKKLDAPRLALLETFVSDIAQTQKNPTTANQIKKAAEDRFGEFWKLFEKKYPKAGAIVPEPEATGAAPEVSDGGEPPTSEPPSMSDFKAQAAALWDDIVNKQFPLKELKAKTGVADLVDITPENYESVKWFVETYGKPTGKGKK